LFFVGLVTGAYGALVGGIGLVIVPLLIILGLPPQIAIGSHRIGVLSNSLFAGIEFFRKKMVDVLVRRALNKSMEQIRTK